MTPLEHGQHSTITQREERRRGMAFAREWRINRLPLMAGLYREYCRAHGQGGAA